MNLDQFKLEILPRTLFHEGGYSNRKNDKGGETYRGISRKHNPNWKGWAIIDSLKPLQQGDIINHAGLKEAVAELYIEKYFLEPQLDKIENMGVCVVLFDLCVNGGYSVTENQRILNKYGAALKVDGVMGKNTAKALNEHISPVTLINELCKYRDERFVRLATEDETQKENLKGWLKRSKLIKLDALRLAK